MRPRDRPITFNNLRDFGHSRTTLKLQLEQFQRDFVRFRVNFHFPVMKVADEAFYTKPLRSSKREVSISDSLHPAAN